MDCSNPAVIKARSERMPLHSVQRKPRIVLAACGCIRAGKFGLLCQEFLTWAEVCVVLTKSSLNFIDTAAIPKGISIHRSDSCYELLQWADIMVIAPLSAHTLAKIAGGVCDDLLTNVVRRWDLKKPFYAAPSMHPFMWKNPFTILHLKRIEKDLAITVIEPATGENEIGSMVEPSEISYTVKIAHNPIWAYYS